jgi:hypothetical protein
LTRDRREDTPAASKSVKEAAEWPLLSFSSHFVSGIKSAAARLRQS